MEKNPKINRRSSARRKSAPSSQLSNPRIRPGIDVVLSLKNPLYKAVMEGYFRRLGGKDGNGDNDAEREVAREALHLFKKEGGVGRGPPLGVGCARFFKPESRYSCNSYVEVDDGAALEKITADVYRRMESAKRWMTDGEGRQPPQARQESLGDVSPTSGDEVVSLTPSMAGPAERPPENVPAEQSATKPPPLKSSTKDAERKHLKKVPRSLPFLGNTGVGRIIVEEELRANKLADGPTARRPTDQTWQPEEVVSFFRGLYAHGWGDWTKVSKMIRTRNNQNVRSYAARLEKRSPELKKFFGSKRVREMQEKPAGAKARRHDAKGVGKASQPKQQTPICRDDSAVVAASLMGAMKHSAPKVEKPKVVVCVGDHVIDSEAQPSSLQPVHARKRPLDALPGRFDPSARPPVSSSGRDIYIPGSRVYCRWLNKDDPGSYGAWYPGYINASKVAPNQDKFNFTGIANLLYHVRFDDGAESFDVDTEDIMMRDHYQSWLKDLEQYYLLDATREMARKRLKKNTRVYARWIDPADPALHGTWMLGKVRNSRTCEDHAKRCRRSYHVLFENEDQDENVQDEDVLEEEVYRKLLAEKTERAAKKPRLSGFDLMAEASEMSSPIVLDPKPQNGLCDGGSSKNQHVNGAERDSARNEPLSNDVREPKLPGSSYVAPLSNASSLDLNFGAHMKSKPQNVSSSFNGTIHPRDETKRNTNPKTTTQAYVINASNPETSTSFVAQDPTIRTKAQKPAITESCNDLSHKDSTKHADGGTNGHTEIVAANQSDLLADSKTTLRLNERWGSHHDESTRDRSGTLEAKSAGSARTLPNVNESNARKQVDLKGIDASKKAAMNHSREDGSERVSQKTKSDSNKHQFGRPRNEASALYPSPPDCDTGLKWQGKAPVLPDKSKEAAASTTAEKSANAPSHKKPALETTYVAIPPAKAFIAPRSDILSGGAAQEPRNPPGQSSTVGQSTSKDLDTYMETWIARSGNNLLPTLAQKLSIVQETGIEKQRLDEWFFRARKKLKKQQELQKAALLNFPATLTIKTPIPSDTTNKAIAATGAGNKSTNASSERGGGADAGGSETRTIKKSIAQVNLSPGNSLIQSNKSFTVSDVANKANCVSETAVATLAAPGVVKNSANTTTQSIVSNVSTAQAIASKPIKAAVQLSMVPILAGAAGSASAASLSSSQPGCRKILQQKNRAQPAQQLSRQ